MRLALIVNPNSGRRRGIAAAEKAEPVLRAAGWEVDRQYTERPGDATRITREAAAEGFDAVFACGGDGSLSQTLTGLLDTGIPGGIIPAGTGNDFARTLGLSLDPARAAAELTRGRPGLIDLLQVNDGALWCVNVAGVGFDARICERINRRPRVMAGTTAYLIALVQELVDLRPTEVSIRVDGASWEGPALLVAVANAQSYGGGMRIAPKADIADGLLDVIVVQRISRLAFIRSFPRVMKGTHLTHPAVLSWRGREATIETSSPSPALIDGDIQAETPLIFRVSPGRARLWMPRKASPLIRTVSAKSNTK